MNRIVSFLLVTVVGLTSAFAASADKTASSADEQALRKIEEKWAEALQKSDMEAAGRFVAPTWTLVTPDGMLLTKEQAESEVKSGAVKFESWHLDDFAVQIHGDTAVVSGLETEKSSVHGTDTSGQYRFTDVFMKHGGEWKCMATHVTKVAQKM